MKSYKLGEWGGGGRGGLRGEGVFFGGIGGGGGREGWGLGVGGGGGGGGGEIESLAERVFFFEVLRGVEREREEDEGEVGGGDYVGKVRLG